MLGTEVLVFEGLGSESVKKRKRQIMQHERIANLQKC